MIKCPVPAKKRVLSDETAENVAKSLGFTMTPESLDKLRFKTQKGSQEACENVMVGIGIVRGAAIIAGSAGRRQIEGRDIDKAEVIHTDGWNAAYKEFQVTSRRRM